LPAAMRLDYTIKPQELKVDAPKPKNNLYLGVNRTGDINRNKFSGVRIQQTRVDSGNVRSDVIIYNDNEKTNNSIARISILGDGNTNIIGNVYIDLLLRSLIGITLFLAIVLKYKLVSDVNDFVTKVKSSRRLF
jgi:hypothetical protein